MANHHGGGYVENKTVLDKWKVSNKRRIHHGNHSSRKMNHVSYSQSSFSTFSASSDFGWREAEQHEGSVVSKLERRVTRGAAKNGSSAG